MRRLPNQLGHVPKIVYLSFPGFFIFGGIAASMRFLVDDDLFAFLLQCLNGAALQKQAVMAWG